MSVRAERRQLTGHRSVARRGGGISLTGKRVLDVVAATLLVIVLAPVAAVIMVAIWLTMGRPVLFLQERPGSGERPFVLRKFRTMSNAYDVDGQLLPDKERLTPVGRFLRSTSLDELPQLVNILQGEMSFIGPRPLLMRYLPDFTERERARFVMRPGLTGWAQIHGRNVLSWDQRLELDAWYVSNWSLWLDARIACRTVSILIRRDGYSEDPNSLMANLDDERQNRIKRNQVP